MSRMLDVGLPSVVGGGYGVIGCHEVNKYRTSDAACSCLEHILDVLGEIEHLSCA